MRADDLVRLRHMLDAAREAVGFVKGLNRADLESDRKLVLALVRAVEIIGEAAYQIPQTSPRARTGHSLGRHHWHAPSFSSRLFRHQSGYPLANRARGLATIDRRNREADFEKAQLISGFFVR